MDIAGQNTVNAHLYALSSSSDGHLVVRCPLTKTSDGRIKAVEGESVFGGKYAWETVGQYSECPQKLLESHVVDKVTPRRGDPVDFKHTEFKTLPKSQDMTILDDKSLLFTVDRSHVVLKHQAEGAIGPELVIDLENLTSPDFDAKLPDLNKDYGVSTAYDSKTQKVYVSFENQIYVLDIAAVRKLPAVGGQVYIKPTPDSFPEYFKPLAVLPEQGSFADAGSSIVKLALTTDKDGNSQLFNSYAIKSRPDQKAPINMILLSSDGSTAVEVAPAPFATAMQYSRMSSTDASTSMKGDLACIATESAPGYPSQMAMHLKYNHPGIVVEPQEKHPAIQAKVAALSESGTLNYQTMNPDEFNSTVEIAREAPSRIYRLHNLGYLSDKFLRSGEFDVNFKPNAHSEFDRITAQTALGKSPKLCLNNDVLRVSQGNMLCFPWRTDLFDKVYAHQLPAGTKAGFHAQPENDWYEMVTLPEVGLSSETPAYQLTQDKKLTTLDSSYREVKASAPRSSGLHWSAFCVDYVS